VSGLANGLIPRAKAGAIAALKNSDAHWNTGTDINFSKQLKL